MKIQSILLLALLNFTSINVLYASESQNEIRFQKALKEYKQHIAKNANRSLTPYAKELYQSASSYYKSDDINLGIIAYNYALAINYGYPSSHTIPLLEQSISIYENADNPPEKELLRSLLELGKVYYSDWNKKVKGRMILTEALNLAKKTGDEIQVAETKLTIGTIFLSYGRLTNKITRNAKHYIDTAYSVLKANNHSKQIEAAFWLGKANLIYKKKETAAGFFELVIDNASNDQMEQYFATTSRAFLVETYTRLGEEEKATEHCQAIGKSQVWDDNKEPTPLYSKAAVYPKSATRNGKEGWAIVEFTIASNGTTKNHKIIETKGSSRFGGASVRAIKKWRFAPKYENGKPVDAVVRYTYSYNLVD